MGFKHCFDNMNEDEENIVLRSILCYLEDLKSFALINGDAILKYTDYYKLEKLINNRISHKVLRF